jgi:hypothetical protein
MQLALHPVHQPPLVLPLLNLRVVSTALFIYLFSIYLFTRYLFNGGVSTSDDIGSSDRMISEYVKKYVEGSDLDLI